MMNFVPGFSFVLCQVRRLGDEIQVCGGSRETRFLASMPALLSSSLSTTQNTIDLLVATVPSGCNCTPLYQLKKIKLAGLRLESLS
jgi:hypothetical protein